MSQIVAWSSKRSSKHSGESSLSAMVVIAIWVIGAYDNNGTQQLTKGTVNSNNNTTTCGNEY